MEINDYNNLCIRYWIEVWADLVEKIKGGSLEDFVSPHIIVRDLIDEINFNELRNANNKKYFEDKIDVLNKKDEIIIKNSSWKLLKESMSKDSFYLLTICKDLLVYFGKGFYFTSLIEHFKELILSNNLDKSKSKIKYYILHIIAEFILRGYELKSIGKIPARILSSYRFSEIDSSRFVHTDYPHPINRYEYAVTGDKNSRKELLLKGYSANLIRKIGKNRAPNNFDGENIDNDKYNQDLVDFMDSLSLEDRLQSLAKLFFSLEKEYVFVFPVQGIRGKYSLKIGNAYFYCPSIERYTSPCGENNLLQDEFFNRSPETYPINVSVIVKSIDLEKAKYQAVKIVNSSFDVFSLYVSGQAKLYVEYNNYIILDSKKRRISTSWGVTRNQEEISNSIDLNVIGEYLDKEIIEKDTSFLTLFPSKPDYESQIYQHNFVKAAHWFRKAEESTSPEDKLLNYWICIESIMKFSDIVKHKNLMPKVELSDISVVASHLIAANCACAFCKDRLVKTYLRAKSSIESYFFSEGITMPIDVRDIFRKENMWEELDNRVKLFFDKASTIKNYTQSEIVKEEIEEACLIYKNTNREAQSKVKSKFYSVLQDVLLIYRLKNQIVHDAHYDNKNLPFYVEKARIYVRSILIYLFGEMSKGNQNILEALMARYHSYNKIVDTLNTGVSIDFLNQEESKL